MNESWSKHSINRQFLRHLLFSMKQFITEKWENKSENLIKKLEHAPKIKLYHNMTSETNPLSSL